MSDVQNDKSFLQSAWDWWSNKVDVSETLIKVADAILPSSSAAPKAAPRVVPAADKTEFVADTSVDNQAKKLVAQSKPKKQTSSSGLFDLPKLTFDTPATAALAPALPAKSAIGLLDGKTLAAPASFFQNPFTNPFANNQELLASTNNLTLKPSTVLLEPKQPVGSTGLPLGADYFYGSDSLSEEISVSRNESTMTNLAQSNLEVALAETKVEEVAPKAEIAETTFSPAVEAASAQVVQVMVASSEVVAGKQLSIIESSIKQSVPQALVVSSVATVSTESAAVQSLTSPIARLVVAFLGDNSSSTEQSDVSQNEVASVEKSSVVVASGRPASVVTQSVVRQEVAVTGQNGVVVAESNANPVSEKGQLAAAPLVKTAESVAATQVTADRIQSQEVREVKGSGATLQAQAYASSVSATKSDSSKTLASQERDSKQIKAELERSVTVVADNSGSKGFDQDGRGQSPLEKIIALQGLLDGLDDISFDQVANDNLDALVARIENSSKNIDVVV